MSRFLARRMINSGRDSDMKIISNKGPAQSDRSLQLSMHCNNKGWNAWGDPCPVAAVKSCQLLIVCGQHAGDAKVACHRHMWLVRCT